MKAENLDKAVKIHSALKEIDEILLRLECQPKNLAIYSNTWEVATFTFYPGEYVQGKECSVRGLAKTEMVATAASELVATVVNAYEIERQRLLIELDDL